jgi:luciferase family oxidoreductase group 1
VPVPAAVSVLDLSPIPSGSTAGDALRNTLDLARHAEALGLRRYWLAEHHNAGGLACSAPEILIGQVAATTHSIRVGSGGIMLPNHSPLKVAEMFRVLHALFPGRIDLGLGRAPGTDPRTAAALRRSREAVSLDNFPEQLAELTRYLDDDGPPRPGFSGTIRAIPTNVPSPELWLLGSGDSGGAVLAAEHGLGFAFAHYMNPDEPHGSCVVIGTPSSRPTACASRGQFSGLA